MPPLIKVIAESRFDRREYHSLGEWTQAIIEINGIKWVSEIPETAGHCQTINNQLRLITGALANQSHETKSPQEIPSQS